MGNIVLFIMVNGLEIIAKEVYTSGKHLAVENARTIHIIDNDTKAVNLLPVSVGSSIRKSQEDEVEYKNINGKFMVNTDCIAFYSLPIPDTLMSSYLKEIS